MKIYSMEQCPYCDELKERLDEMEIEYEDCDISEESHAGDFEKICELTKGDSVPVIIVNQTILAPDVSFKTIEEAALLVQSLNT